MHTKHLHTSIGHQIPQERTKHYEITMTTQEDTMKPPCDRTKSLCECTKEILKELKINLHDIEDVTPRHLLFHINAPYHQWQQHQDRVQQPTLCDSWNETPEKLVERIHINNSKISFLIYKEIIPLWHLLQGFIKKIIWKQSVVKHRLTSLSSTLDYVFYIVIYGWKGSIYFFTNHPRLSPWTFNIQHQTFHSLPMPFFCFLSLNLELVN